MNSLPTDTFSVIFQFIGDYDELTRLRIVSKQFRNNIQSKHINQLVLTENNKYLLFQISKQLIILNCSRNEVKNVTLWY